LHFRVTVSTTPGTYTDDAEGTATGFTVVGTGATAPVRVTPTTTSGPPDMHSVIQVEASPLYAGKTITISSSQLQAACASVSYETLQGGSVTDPTDSPNSISVVLDADGNATVVVNGTECVPGPDVVNATLSTSQWSINATTTLVVNPPQMTFPWQVAGYPNNEVETGNTLASGNSDLYAVFSLETSPGYAEKTATISSPQLEKRCGEGYRWESNAKTSPFVNSKTATAIVDDDGNATFVFKGASCAGGTSKVTVKVGKHTYTTEYSIDPPAVTYTGPLHKMFISASPNPVILTGDPS